MHVIAPEGVSTCRSKNVKGDWVEKVYDCVIACSSPEGNFSDMQVIEDFESRPHNAVIFVVEKGKAGMERAKNSRRRYPRTQWRKATRSTEEKGGEEEE